MTGNAGSNRLNGGAGADTMAGAAGDDTYVVDQASDRIIESSEGGTDTVRSAASYTLAAHVEQLVLTGTAALHGTGNSLSNRIVGNSAANVLAGGTGGGADTLVGGGGNDTYRAVRPIDTIVEAANGGTDTVTVAIQPFYQLPDHVENGVLTQEALDPFLRTLSGNGLDNTLTGSLWDDELRGGAGRDTMNGGAGSDIYEVDNAGDVVVDTVDRGYDTVIASVDYVAPTGIEFVELIGGGHLSATGNALNNELRGNAGDNVLDGLAGNDEMTGGAGDDVYVVDSYGDRCVEQDGPAGGHDVVRASAHFDLGANGLGVEDLVLTGTADLNGGGNHSANTIAGNAGNNVLNGHGGIDIVSYADAGAGVNVDLRAGVAVGFGSDTLVNFENIVGSSWADTLRGNDAHNELRGGEGADVFVLEGAAAADTVLDFSSGLDQLHVSQSVLSVGNGDLQIDGALSLDGAGAGFGVDAELVLVQQGVGGSLSTSSAAAVIGSATSAYDNGQTVLFVVHDTTSTGLYRFSSANGDAVVEAEELTLLATLQGTPAVAAGDFAWIA